LSNLVWVKANEHILKTFKVVIGAMKSQEKHYSTGAVARAVGCSRWTVARYLQDKGIKPKPGFRHHFSEREYRILVNRLKAAHKRYPHHPRRYERVVNGNHRVFEVQDLGCFAPS